MKLVQSFIEGVQKLNPQQERYIRSSLEAASEEELNGLKLYLNFCIDQGYTIGELSEAYNTIVQDTVKEQFFFMRNKRYRYSTFEEVAQDVYFNEQYMTKYMLGLAITTFIWKNHRAISTFFRESLPKGKSGTYLEVGPGHGWNFMQAMQQGSFDKYIGVDISPTSLSLTNKILSNEMFRTEKSYELHEKDFLSWDVNQKPDAFVMGEVLEHVEQPEVFLQKVSEISKSDTHIFITTCINAPAIDHIYLYRTPEELEKQFEHAGLKIENQLLTPYEGLTLEETLAQTLPLNVAYSLRKIS
ncbi:MAG: class I SAM-dependent methyltransferase [Desulfovibrio sp.]